MYAWIWRKLPYGLRGKLAGSFLLIASVTALLWFVVFPAIEPDMPFNDGQMDDSSEVVPSDVPAAPVTTTRPAGGTSSVPVSPSRSNR